MPILDINLLQQEQTRVTRLSRASVIVSVVVGSVVILMLLVVVFLYTTIAIRTGQKDGLIKQRGEFETRTHALDKQNSSQYANLTLSQQAKAYQGQVQGARNLVDNHKYFTLYLSEIAINTPPTVVYSSFTSDSPTHLTITGAADNYGEVSRIVESFGKLSFAKSATLQDAKLEQAHVGKGLAVKFSMIIELKSAAELRKLPGPDTAVSGSSPKPQASSSPSVNLPVQGSQ